MNKKTARNLLAFLTLVLLTGILLMGGANRSRDLTQSDDPAGWQTISDLVANKDAIVIGTASGQYTETLAIDPTPPGGWPTGIPTLPPTMAAEVSTWDASDHEFASHQTLYHNGEIPTGETFLVRMMGHPSEHLQSDIYDRYPNPQAQYLLFLESAEPEEPGLYAAIEMLRIDGDTVTRLSGSAFPLASGMLSNEFVEEVLEDIEEQYGP